jgi:hypothetical protein
VRLAMSGIRLVVEEFRSDVTKTLKSGEPGTLRIDYGDPHDPSAPLKWMWKFIVCRARGYAESMRDATVGGRGARFRARHNHSDSRKASSLSGGR